MCVFVGVWVVWLVGCGFCRFIKTQRKKKKKTKTKTKGEIRNKEKVKNRGEGGKGGREEDS